MCKDTTNLEKEIKLALQSLELHQHYTHLPADTSTATRQLLRRGLEKELRCNPLQRGEEDQEYQGGMNKTQPGRPPKDFKRKIDETEGSDSDDFDRFSFRVRKMSKVKKRKHDLSSNNAQNLKRVNI